MRKLGSARHIRDWRLRWREIIFETNTREGRAFDLILLFLILLSVMVVMLDSITRFHLRYGWTLYMLEWVLTFLFTIEYIMRIITSEKPRHYVLSFFGIIDLLAIVPTYLSIFFVGYQYLTIIRILRLLRIFRILKLVRFIRASHVLAQSIRNNRFKILVFLEFMLLIVTILGSIMYLIEGPENGFKDIPTSIYWAIVTMTTVGYGDIAPQTGLGQIIASFIMILGYAIIAIPTGIVTVEMARQSRNVKHRTCPHCGMDEHLSDANFCRICASSLNKPAGPSSPPR